MTSKKKRPAPKAKKRAAPKPKGTAVAVAKLKEQANKGGRPARLFQAEDMETIFECALMGWTNAEIAEELGVGETKFYEWKAEFPEITETLTRARRKTTARVAKAILARAEGGIVKEKQAIKIKLKGGGEDVKLVETEKYIPPDTAAGVYWMNNRAREHWKMLKATEHTGKGGGPIEHEVITNESVVAAMNEILEALR